MRSRAILLAVAFFLLAALTAGASAPPLGKLETGPYAVGFRVTERQDPSRFFRFPFDLQGRPRSGVITRPMQISVWYPAEKSEAVRMRLRDYVALMATEKDFSVPTSMQGERGAAALFGFGVMRELEPAQRTKLLDFESLSVRDARPLHGKFPVILWSLGSPALYAGSCEYLASHGYVVVTMPRLPDTRGLVDTSPTRTDYETKARDMAYLLNELTSFPSADLRTVGVTGFSAGGRWALAEAMRNPAVRAVVSMDSIVLFDDDGGQFMQSAYVHPDRLRVPILHMVRRVWVPQEKSTLWKEMRFADRTHYVFEKKDLDHFDFASIGFASTLAGGRPAMKQAVSETFHAFNRLMLAFFEAHLKNSAKGRSVLAGGAKALGLPDGVLSASHESSSGTKLSEAQFIDAAADDLESALHQYRKMWKESGSPPFSENTLNLTGYQLIGSGRVAEAVTVFELNAEVFPVSANAYDSLSDAYLASGDERRALELANRVLLMLESDPSSPERREAIRNSAQAKVNRLSSTH